MRQKWRTRSALYLLALAPVLLGLLLWLYLAEWAQSQMMTGHPPPPFAPGKHKAQLLNCINNHQPPANITTWAGAMADEPFAIPVAGAWWSAKPPAAELTVTTQMSYNRVHQLVAMCRSWRGPISAAVLVPLPHRAHTGSSHEQHAGNHTSGQHAHSNDTDQLLAAAISNLSRLHEALEASYPCQLDLLLAFEHYENKKTAMLYPVNVMRNYAKLQARTRLIGQFDADMMISRTLFKWVTNATLVQSLHQLVEASTAVVIPGFITRKVPGRLTARQLADRLALNATNKRQLRPYFEAKLLERFDPAGDGHRATKSGYWFKTDEFYNITYEYRYEPWVVVHRTLAPFFDARFRGYGQNKIIHLEHLNWTGYTFTVHPTAFLIHRHHQTTQVKLQHAQDAMLHHTRPTTVYGHANWLAERIRRGLRAGNYTPVLDTATEACRLELAWWWSRGGDGASAVRRRA